MFIDITDRLLPAFDEVSANANGVAAKAKMTRSDHPQAGLMFAKLAAHRADKLDTAEDEFSDFSHAVNFRALATCLHELIEPDVEPSFEEPLRPDPEVQHAFTLQLMNEINLHQAACLRAGLRKCWYDAERDIGELRLTKRRRRSALTLIDEPAHLDLLQATIPLPHDLADQSGDAVFFACASAQEHLRFVCEADPQSWEHFEQATGVSSDLLTGFSGFLVFLDFAARKVGHSLGYTEEQLRTLADVYKLGFPDTAINAANVLRLVEQFSLTAEQACDLLLPVPFFRFGGLFLRHIGFENIMDPAMGLLTILVRKHDQAWNNTVGSTLARAADVLAATLPSFDRLKVAVRRKLAGAGDVDLVLYDVESRQLLLCEVKTVYDKHRTVLHMHRFEEAKVNVARAVEQLRDAAAAVNSGAIDMHAMFQAKLPAPLGVSIALVTWFDPVDLTIDTPDEDILSLNFATLRALLGSAEGNVDVLCRSARELRNIWCVSELRPIDLRTDFATKIENQIPALDSPADLAQLSLTPLTRGLLEHLPVLPDGWRTFDPDPPIVSYLADTVAALSNPGA